MTATVHSEGDIRILRALAQRVDPGDAGACNNLGVVFYQKGLFEEAIEQFRRALAIDGKMEVARRNLDIAYHQTGYFDRRIAELIARLRTSEDDDDARFSLAEAYFNTGRFDEAIAQYEELIERKPGNVRVLLRLGAAEKQRGELKRAIAWFERARVLQPDRPFIYYSLGEILYNQGMNEEAIAHLQKALQLNPAVADVHHLLSFVYGDIGATDKAAEHAARAAELNPAATKARANLSLDRYSPAQYVELTGKAATPGVEGQRAFAHYSLGIAFRARGLYEEAREEFRRGRQAGEDSSLIDQAEAELTLLEGDTGGALARYDALLARVSDSPKVWNERGVTLHQVGRLDEAEDSYRRALGIDEGYALAWNNLGVAAAHRGDDDSAETAFRRALEIQPELNDARLNLGLHWVLGGRHDSSLQLHREMLQLDSSRADAWNGLGTALMAVDRLAEARNAFARAVEANPNYPPARYNLSFALARLGDHEGALRETKMALELDPYYTAPRYRLSIDLQYEGSDVWAPELAAPERVAPKGEGVRDFDFNPAELETAFHELVGPQAEEQAAAPDESFELAQDHLGSGLLDQALAEAARVVREGGDAAEGALIIGEVYLQRGLYGEALERFEEARALRPDDPQALAGATHCLLQLDRVDEARMAAEALQPLAGRNVAHLLMVGEALIRSDDAKRAMEVLDLAAQVSPQDPVVHPHKAPAAQGVGHPRRARDAYRMAIAADPDFTAARVEFGRLLVDEGAYSEAEAEIRQALELMPTYADGALALAELLSRQGRGREAVNALVTFLETEPYNLDALALLGEALIAEGMRRDAEQALVRVLRFDPERPAVLFRLGELTAESGRYREALGYWRRLIEAAPDSEYAARARVQARVALGMGSAFAGQAAGGGD
jgi:tetratricopeptide (TPR) repeat protein